jgi:hypothetical protein
MPKPTKQILRKERRKQKRRLEKQHLKEIRRLSGQEPVNQEQIDLQKQKMENFCENNNPTLDHGDVTILVPSRNFLRYTEGVCFSAPDGSVVDGLLMNW